MEMLLRKWENSKELEEIHFGNVIILENHSPAI
jgi:hypothetical protein